MEISLHDVTLALTHEYYKDFQNDPDIFMDLSRFAEYHYNPAVVDARYHAQKFTADRKNFFIMADGKSVGEICLKQIDNEKKQAELSIHLQNDSVKNKGIGTKAEQLLLAYAFDVMHLELVFANAVLKNTRSQRVLEKVGFEFVKQEGSFKYYQYTRKEYELRSQQNDEQLYHYPL